MDKKERTIYFDYLRVFATLSVIILHVSSQNWYFVNVDSFEWKVFNLYDSIVRWGVPVFVMISGALFLDRNITLKTIYKKYILRMVISFFVWSLIYVMFDTGTPFDKIVTFLTGHYHLWFILMIIGIYMCIPFIKPIVENNNNIKYFLILAFIISFVIPTLNSLVNDFGNEIIIRLFNTINQNLTVMNVNIILGYTFYFVLGYYINKISLKKRHRIVIYILGIFGFIGTIWLDLIVALITNTPCSKYYGNFNVNVVFEALAVFTWFKYRKYNYNKTNMMVRKISKCCFGIYLVHVLVIEQLNYIVGLNTLSFNPVLSVIYITFIVFVISFAISIVLNHIPLIKKYIV